MLKEIFLPGRAFVFFIIILLSISFFLAVIGSVADYIMIYLKYYQISEYQENPLFLLWYYFIFIVVGIFIYFIFFLLLLIEFIYRYNNLSFWIFLLMSVIVSGFCAWLALENHITAIPALKIKYIICFVLGGIAYPFISNFWARKIKFIKLVPVEDEL